MAYLSPAAKQALSSAVIAIESASSAEVVVAMRPTSVPWALPSALGAACAGLLGLGFLLFSPFPFSHEAILLDTCLSGLFGAACTYRFPVLRRLLTPPVIARDVVYKAACAEFLARGITATRGRTGLLLYVSQVERRAVVIADVGLKRAFDAQAGALFERHVAHIALVVRQSEDGVALADAIRTLAPLLAQVLPRAADDLNELEDAVCEA